MTPYKFKFRIADTHNKVFLDASLFGIDLITGEVYRIGSAGKLPMVIPQAYTGIRDLTGTEIFVGDILEFSSTDGCKWTAEVIFEDGVYTVSILNRKQISNPNGWEQPHDWIKSRWWTILVGYGEFGTWNCPRKALTDMDVMFNSYETMKPILEKIGHGHRVINAKIIGNVIDNPFYFKASETEQSF
jgi:hypothetical protein